MSVNSNWDIDYYKTDYESEEHWNLRKRFMQVHKKKFNEDELVCLAQVFTNVEFMGCKYPDETMRMVGELSQEVAKEFRAERSKRLQRTFVKASDAAEARAKVRRTQPVAGGRDGGKNNRPTFGQSSAVDPVVEQAKKQAANLMVGLKYGNYVLYLFGDRSCLQISAKRCSMPVVERETTSKGVRKRKFEIFIANHLAGEAVCETLKLAKSEAFKNAIAELRQHCYIIKPNPDAETIKISKSNENIVADIKQPEIKDTKIDSSNVGYKMMKMMGWSGGGLGSKTQGREDPIGYLLKTNRSGLGRNAMKMDKQYFRQILQNYYASDDIRDLHFEASFTKEERALLHEIAGNMALKSQSHGKGDERGLVISKKNISNEDILREVLINQTPSYCNKYFVQVPPSKHKEFPLHTTQLEFY